MIKSNGVKSVTREEAVARALLASKHKGYGYKLGSGGRNPFAEVPYSKAGFVDCSGFTAWACGYDRLQNIDDRDYGWEEHWWNTDSILFEALDDAGEDRMPDSERWFRCVEKTEDVLPGDILVYASTWKNDERTPGHVGMIVHVSAEFQRGAAGWFGELTVAHSTPKHRLKYGNCVALTDARAWRKSGYIVRYLKFAGEQ